MQHPEIPGQLCSFLLAAGETHEQSVSRPKKTGLDLPVQTVPRWVPWRMEGQVVLLSPHSTLDTKIAAEGWDSKHTAYYIYHDGYVCLWSQSCSFCLSVIFRTGGKRSAPPHVTSPSSASGAIISGLSCKGESCHSGRSGETSDPRIFSLHVTVPQQGPGSSAVWSWGVLGQEWDVIPVGMRTPVVRRSYFKWHWQCDLTNTIRHSARKPLIFLGITVWCTDTCIILSGLLLYGFTNTTAKEKHLQIGVDKI